MGGGEEESAPFRFNHSWLKDVDFVDFVKLQWLGLVVKDVVGDMAILWKNLSF